MKLSRPQLPELTRNGWLSVIAWTIGTTLMTCMIAIAASAVAKWLNGTTVTLVDVAVAIVMSMLLAIPVIGVLSIKIQELKLANEKIRAYAMTDPMTGLLNRDTFMRRVQKLFATPGPERKGFGPGSLLAIDVDHFKLVNDTFGHHWGDEALKIIADAIRAELRIGDLSGRMGGEEFGAFLVGADRQEAEIVADRIRQSIYSAIFKPEGISCPLSISIGIGMGVWGRSFTELYKESDGRLYTAKNNGRNRVESGQTAHFRAQQKELDLSDADDQGDEESDAARRVA